LNCGFLRLKGRERTSATAVMPFAVNKLMNFSVEWFECPTV
jgi:hypothetical protein